MSLKAFHIVFVIVTVILSLYVALWGFREYSQEQSTMGLALGLIFLVSAAALIVYGKKAFVKLRDLP